MLWDLNDGKHLHTLDHNDIIEALCFSPNRYWLCAAFGPSIKIWVSSVQLCIAKLLLLIKFFKRFSFRIWKAKKWLRNSVQKLFLNRKTAIPNHLNACHSHGQPMDKHCSPVIQTITLEFGKCLSVLVNVAVIYLYIIYMCTVFIVSLVNEFLRIKHN